MTKCPHCGNAIRYITDGLTIFIVDTEEKTLITERGRSVKGFVLHACPCQKYNMETAASATVTNSVPTNSSEAHV